MNIKDTITTMETKLSDIDSLLDAYNEAESAGQRFKAHGIAKDAEKIADEIEKLVYAMDDSDLEEILKEEEDGIIQGTVEALVDKTNALSKLVMEYVEATKEDNQIGARRKLKEIKHIGYEIAHITDAEP